MVSGKLLGKLYEMWRDGDNPGVKGCSQLLHEERKVFFSFISWKPG